jgi:hypothetical protein
VSDDQQLPAAARTIINIDASAKKKQKSEKRFLV